MRTVMIIAAVLTIGVIGLCSLGSDLPPVQQETVNHSDVCAKHSAEKTLQQEIDSQLCASRH